MVEGSVSQMIINLAEVGPIIAYGDKMGMLKITFTTYPKLFIGV